MMKNTHVHLVIILFFFCAIGFAQKDGRLVTKANQQYESYSFSPAIDIYKRILDKGYVSADILQKLGNSYYYNADYENAAKIYKRFVDEYPTEVQPEYFFRYAQTLKSLGDYENANNVMNQFTAATTDDSRAMAYKSEEDYLEDIKKNSNRYEMKSFEYNTPYSEFAPSFYKEGLIFSSDRDTGNFAKYRHTWNAKDFLDIYRVNVDSFSMNKVVKIDAYTKELEAIAIANEEKKNKQRINTRLHESTSYATKDGSVLYFTRNNFKDGKYVKDENGVIRLKIFRAVLLDGVWTDIEELPFNSDTYSVAHPALSPDEKTLYFASDMPGTYGESDIYSVAINDDGSFGEPQNLGPKINTEARETFPFVSSEEILYVSTDGHPGLGGLDVFATKLVDGKVVKDLVNVGEPVNSKKDDFTFIFDAETKMTYFASNRADNMGADDIYKAIEKIPLKLECEQKVSGTVRDKVTNEVLVGATVKVIDESNKEIKSTITDAEGNYELIINCDQGNFVRALTHGYVPFEEYLEISEGEPKVIDFYLERDELTAKFGDDLAKLLQLSTIYFDFDKYNIREDSKIEVEKVIAVMEKYPSLKIKVNSHTDSRGKDSYNLMLSQKRAEATVNYMISKGISKDRLKGEGFGETKLINKCSNGVACSDVQHELNRRSEFIILE